MVASYGGCLVDLQNDKLLKIVEAAPLLNACYETCRRMVATGEIPTVMIGKRKKILLSVLNAYVRSRMQAEQVQEPAATPADRQRLLAKHGI